MSGLGGGVLSTPVDVRVLAATNRDLQQDVERGTFREDLFFRLNVIRIHMPPLRERPEDIPYLVHHFLEKFNKALHRDIQGVAPEVMQVLLAYRYPGNVRELENILEHAATFASGPQITMEDLPEQVRKGTSSPPEARQASRIPEDGLDVEAYLADIERTILLEALRRTRGVRKDAAELLRISFRSLRYKLAKYGISDADQE
jgi:two-component system response regulator PilR (NtrC family)